MPSTRDTAFLNLSLDEIITRVRDAAAGAAGAPVAVRVSDEAYGARNVGVDLPSGPLTADARRRLRVRVREALVAAGVSMAPHALVTRVAGDILGSISVRDPEPRSGDGDLAHVSRPSGR